MMQMSHSGKILFCSQSQQKESSKFRLHFIFLNIIFSNLNKKEDPGALEAALSKSEIVYPVLILSLILNLLTAGLVINLFTPFLNSNQNVVEKMDNFAPVKPHTVYDEILGKLNNEDLLFDGEIEEDRSEDVSETFPDDKMNEIR